MNSMFGGMGQGGRGAGPSGAGGQLNPTGLYKEKIPKGYAAGQLQQFSPEQMQLFRQLFGQVGPESYLSQLAGGSQEGFEQQEAPALRQFNELQGNIASRFSQGGGGQGALGARRSSGFQNYQNQASSNFAQDLSSKRQDLQRQAINDLMGISSNLLAQKPFERTLTEKPKPWWQSLLSTFGSSLASEAGKSLGGFGRGSSGGQLNPGSISRSSGISI